MAETSRKPPSSEQPREEHPLVELWTIAWPTVLTMTSYTVMQFADKLMVGQVGPVEVAAQGNGGIWAFTPIAFTLGLLTVVNTFVSQSRGAKRVLDAPRYGWASLWLSGGMWVVLMLPYALLLKYIFPLIHSAQREQIQNGLEKASGADLLAAQAELEQLDRLIGLETQYAQILLAGSILLLISRALHHYFFGLQRPKVATVSAICGNTTNVTVNYVLIFGHLGAPGWGLPGIPGVPALGLTGAALGTIAGTLVESVIPVVLFLGPSMNRELQSRRQWRPQKGPILDLLRIGAPAGIQVGNEMACWSIFMTRLVGVFGTYHQTAGWISITYIHLSFMPALGLSVAVTSLVGNYQGAGQPDVAAARARLGVLVGLIYMTLFGALFYLFRYELVSIFVGGLHLDAGEARQIVEIGATLMICAAIFQAFDAFGIIYTGALRGAGDTLWPSAVTLLYNWTIILGGGWLMTRYYPQLESVGPWVAATVYIIILGVTMAYRFESGRWRTLRILEPTKQDAARIAPLSPTAPVSEPGAAVVDIAEEVGRVD
jgi:MATE family multidrug resistance protein